MSSRPFVIVAGGTGGHILPGIRIGEALAARHLSVEYISGPRPIERDVYRGEGVTPLVISTGGYRGVGRQIVQCAEFLFDMGRIGVRFLGSRPVGVLAMGGAASFPVLAAAVLLGVPIFLHESNRIPGRVIRLFQRFARRVYLGLGGLDGANVEVVGTPTRLPKQSGTARDIVLCVGGSQGSARLNELFLAAVEPLVSVFPNHRFVLIAGPSSDSFRSEAIEIRGYEPKLADLLASTELIVSRAGAGALADVANFRLPAILVPYPFAKDDHQRANAHTLADKGAAICQDEASLTAESLRAQIKRLLSSEEERRALRNALAPFDSTHSADTIADSILKATAPESGRRQITQGTHS